MPNGLFMGTTSKDNITNVDYNKYEDCPNNRFNLTQGIFIDFAR